jgi:uncharacterized protein (DUF302 family)
MVTSRFTFITIVISTIILAGCSMGELMVHEVKSPYDFEKTVALVTETAKGLGWVVPKVYDFQKSLVNFDQADPGKIKVLKVCKPEYAASLLKQDKTKFISVMMPCSVSIYEKSDGTTYVATMNLELFSKLFSGDAAKILAMVAEEDRNILAFMAR